MFYSPLELGLGAFYLSLTLKANNREILMLLETGALTYHEQTFFIFPAIHFNTIIRKPSKGISIIFN